MPEVSQPWLHIQSIRGTLKMYGCCTPPQTSYIRKAVGMGNGGGAGGKYPGHKILKLPREFSSEPGKAENMDHLTA